MSIRVGTHKKIQQIKTKAVSKGQRAIVGLSSKYHPEPIFTSLSLNSESDFYVIH